MTNHKTICTLGILALSFTACSSDSDDELGTPESEAAFEVVWDDASASTLVASSVASEIAVLIDDGPMTADVPTRSIDYECGQTSIGSCPTVTAACEAGKVTGAQLVFASQDGCTDASGVSVSGTVVFTRNALRDWTADLQSIRWGDLTFEGQVRFVSASGEPWSVSLMDFRVQGQAAFESEDSTCSKSCVRSTSLQAQFDVSVSTTAPISVDLVMLGEKSVTINGGVAVTGSVAGHVAVLAKGPLGGDQTAVDRQLDMQMEGQTATLTELMYGIPPTCSCPASGAIQTASLADCGTAQIAFEAASPCPVVSVTYETASSVCDATAGVMEDAIGSRCKPAAVP